MSYETYRYAHTFFNIAKSNKCQSFFLCSLFACFYGTTKLLWKLPYNQENQRHGRPKESKNKKKTKKQKQRRRDEVTSADAIFGEAFFLTMIIIWSRERFWMNLLHVGHEDEEDTQYDDETCTRDHDNSNENIGFGLADMYNVDELIELSNMDLKESRKKRNYYR